MFHGLNFPPPPLLRHLGVHPEQHLDAAPRWHGDLRIRTAHGRAGGAPHAAGRPEPRQRGPLARGLAGDVTRSPSGHGKPAAAAAVLAPRWIQRFRMVDTMV